MYLFQYEALNLMEISSFLQSTGKVMQTSTASETWGDGIYFYVRQIPAPFFFFFLNLWSLVQLTESHSCVDKNHLKPWAHLKEEIKGENQGTKISLALLPPAQPRTQPQAEISLTRIQQRQNIQL